MKHLLTLALCFLCFSAIAQKELKNKISDFGTLMPIESASIYVQNTTIGTVSNADGKFVLQVPLQFASDTLVISSIGYKSFKTTVSDFDNTQEIYLEEDVASLDEIVLVAETRPKTGNDIVLKALEKLSVNMPEQPYLQKGFLRHKERNRREFKWLIESAITVYDSAYTSPSKENLKINVDQVRKSYDLRDVDSLLTYTAYLKENANRVNLQARNLRRDTIKTSSLVKAIKWNDTRINGLQNLFESKLNVFRNVNATRALFGEDVLDTHQFRLDTILVDNDRKLYKIKISESHKYVNLETKGVFNDGYHAKGWLYIYYDNYAIKKLEYELEAASKAQKSRSKTLFDTQINHKITMTFREYQGKMYPNYIYYETPKLVNVGYKPTKPGQVMEEETNTDERFYYTVQEVLFTEIILDADRINEALQHSWDPDIFAVKPYNKEFWRNYNTLLESEEDEKLIQDLTKRSSLFKD
ncbi:carboxypeptidase-like regulatory domain-containing protein [Gelidibacter salicanalis]|uniref:Carboxypeptidase-like regulatory domain-containing protein n=1 Tax=Gelidibacter salicanalis TaxID=291193 RepID=A0A5C7AN87_9FLAO|nr:carboxypeptidase-like regulatory domain-containing protein [Gelidibacter salicanalis]TXE09414.1 carboxypeptidase-like regulatory domain-containing protein [Gelidibacter salicanalis]